MLVRQDLKRKAIAKRVGVGLNTAEVNMMRWRACGAASANVRLAYRLAYNATDELIDFINDDSNFERGAYKLTAEAERKFNGLMKEHLNNKASQ